MILRLLSLTMGLISLLSATSAQVPRENTLLWEVTGKGIRQPSYLFGTMHIMCPEDVIIPETVKKKFGKTRQLYLEIKLDDPNMMMEMLAGMIMKNDSTIDQLMDEKTYDSIGRIFQSRTGFPLGTMKKSKPIMLMSLIYPSLMNCQPQSWEQLFQEMAATQKMELKGLEKLADQVKVFETIPYQLQADMLVKTLLKPDSSKQVLDKMIEVYRLKNINAMYEMTTSDKDFGDYEETLLTTRNKKWIPVIMVQTKKMPTFFAFGAGHMGGPNGVVALLREKGIVVKPVFYK